MPIPFLKMHGAGNDFVVVDGRTRPVSFSPAAARLIADRKRGVGCDQIIIIEADGGGADAFMRIVNADGTEAGACGNATRCVAALVAEETGARRLAIRTVGGVLEAEILGPSLVEVDMGPPRLDWGEIPLSGPADTLHLKLAMGLATDPAACSMGNPHVTFFVDDVTRLPIEAMGPALERHKMFPERANIGFAVIESPERIRLTGVGTRRRADAGLRQRRLRGAGQRASPRAGRAAPRPAACWTAACSPSPGAQSDDHVLMRGPAVTAFAGRIAGPRLTWPPASSPNSRPACPAARKSSAANITAAFVKRKLDDAALEELEEFLIARRPRHPRRFGGDRKFP